MSLSPAQLCLPTALRAKLSLAATMLGLLLCLVSIGTAAEEMQDMEDSGLLGWFDSAYFQAGASIHWREGDDYDGVPVLLGIEAAHQDRHLFGISLFNNSFEQFCQYYYYGYKWKLPSISESFHVKLSGGLVYGYKDEFEDKLPFNHDGLAPVIIPSLGWKSDRLGFDVILLGASGLMFTVGYDIWQR